MNKGKENKNEKVELSAEAVFALQEQMIEEELAQMKGFAPLIKTLRVFGIRGIKALRFISTLSAYTQEDGNEGNNE